MGKPRCVLLFVERGRSHGRHEHHIAIIGAAGAAQVRMREAVDDIVGIMITGTAVPTSVDAGIRRQLHHSERHGCPGKGVPMAAGSD